LRMKHWRAPWVHSGKPRKWACNIEKVSIFIVCE
jgi:hypothetical protein